MIQKALEGEGELPEGISKPVEEIAELVEETIFKKFKETNPKYKNQIRSRVFNLKVYKNLISFQCTSVITNVLFAHINRKSRTESTKNVNLKL